MNRILLVFVKFLMNCSVFWLFSGGGGGGAGNGERGTGNGKRSAALPRGMVKREQGTGGAFGAGNGERERLWRGG